MKVTEDDAISATAENQPRRWAVRFENTADSVESPYRNGGQADPELRVRIRYASRNLRVAAPHTSARSIDDRSAYSAHGALDTQRNALTQHRGQLLVEKCKFVVIHGPDRD